MRSGGPFKERISEARGRRGEKGREEERRGEEEKGRGGQPATRREKRI
jgi:hypothetical protein